MLVDPRISFAAAGGRPNDFRRGLSGHRLAAVSKNTPARIALWLMLPVVLVAVFAPLLASDQPLVFHDHGRTLYPWFRALWNPARRSTSSSTWRWSGFVPWLVAAVVLDRIWKRRGASPRHRGLGIAAVYVLLVAAATVLFSIPGLGLRPENRYCTRGYAGGFAEEEFTPRRCLLRPLHPDALRPHRG